MTKRQAHVIALRIAYNAINKACGVGGDETDNEDDQQKIDDALDTIAQRMYERMRRLEES